MKKGKSPQRKKAESYQNDRRNGYGENSKSSRKNIRRRKRKPNRSNRRAAAVVLSASLDPADETAVERAEVKLEGKKQKRWTKQPDIPLGQNVVKKLERRVRLEANGSPAIQAKLAAVRKAAKKK